MRLLRNLLPWAFSLAISILVATVTSAWVYACIGVWPAVGLQLAAKAYIPFYALCWTGLLWPGTLLAFLGGLVLGLWQLHQQDTDGD